MTRPTTPENAIIRSHPIFSHLDELDFDAFAGGARTELLPPRFPIFHAGDQARDFFIVVEGVVRLFRLEADGDEVTIGVFRDGQSFAEAAIFMERRFPVSAETVSETRLIRIDAGLIVERIKADPALALAMLASMSTHLKQLVEEVALLRTPTARNRVAKFLLQWCEAGDDVSAQFDLPYSKTLIAQRLGITRESLSRAFVNLRSDGVAVSGKRVTIKNTRALRTLIQD